MNLLKKFRINFERITLIRLEWNENNGFIFELLCFDIHTKWGEFIRCLLGLSFAETYCYVDFLFFEIKLFDKTE